MYNVSSDFLTAVRQPGRVFKSKVTVKKTGHADLNLTDAQIMSIKLSSSSISGEDFEIGTTCAAQLDIEIANLDGSLTTAAFQDAQILASIGVLLANCITFEYCPLGVFYVDTPTRKDTSIKLICYDAMVQLEMPYQTSLSYPATLLQIAQDIASKSGLSLATATFPNSTFSVSATPSLASVTLRAALSWVAEASATFARISREGNIELASYTATTTAITPANYFKLQHDDLSRSAITQVTIKATDSDTGASMGIAGNTYTIVGNPLLLGNPSRAITAIYNQLSGLLYGFTYMPFTAEWQGNPACMVGDIISITDRGGSTYDTILTECDIEYEGGIKGIAAAKALTNTGQKHQTAAAFSNGIAQAQGTAYAAQTTANSASSIASTAQTTANSASSAASTAQTTANSAATAANTAQTTANAAQSTANSAFLSANGKNTVYRQSNQPRPCLKNQRDCAISTK